MIRPVPPIGAELIRPMAGFGRPLNATARSDSPALGSSAAGDVMGTSQAVAQMQTALTELLGGLGGGLQNDKMLKALITLLILVALLGQLQELNESGGSGSRQAASGMGNAPSMFATYSSTTILFEQTTTTVVFQAFDESSAGAASPDSQGRQLDLNV